jgi:hypothetical protein
LLKIKCFFFKGFLEKEISKEKEIAILEQQEICDAPKPKEMIDLEVKCHFSYLIFFFIYLNLKIK